MTFEEKRGIFTDDPVIVCILEDVIKIGTEPHVPSPDDNDQFYRICHYALVSRCIDLFGPNWNKN